MINELNLSLFMFDSKQSLQSECKQKSANTKQEKHWKRRKKTSSDIQIISIHYK